MLLGTIKKAAQQWEYTEVEYVIPLHTEKYEKHERYQEKRGISG